MGREIQKKKNRSGIQKVRHKPKSKKKILNNPIIAANWNQRETLTQNYRRLGLAAKINHQTGGTQLRASTIPSLPEAAAGARAPAAPKDPLAIPSLKDLAAHGGVAEAKVERDPATGKIVRVIEDDEGRKPNPLNDPLNEVLGDDDEEGEEWKGFAHVPASEAGGTTTEVVRQLEELARGGVRKAPRHQSQREEEWVERLVEKYGDDYGRMWRDTKLNPMQQSEGDIRRRVEKWKRKNGKA